MFTAFRYLLAQRPPLRYVIAVRISADGLVGHRCEHFETRFDGFGIGAVEQETVDVEIGDGVECLGDRLAAA